MKIYSLVAETELNARMEDVWEYFSSPENLNALTPDDMQFEILTDVRGVKMYPGMIINYRISPFAGVRFGWTTEITHCEDHHYFVDEQRFGPYAFWHHRHHFEQRGEKIIMTDTVHYALPFGFLGRMAHALFVKKKLEGIFSFREQAIRKVFPGK